MHRSQIEEALETGVLAEDVAFKEPWMARAFGLTLALAEAGHFSLKDFQKSLISAVGSKEKASCIADEEAYYECWIEALIYLLRERNVLREDKIAVIEKALVEDAAARRDHQHHHVRRNTDGSPIIEPIALDQEM